MKPVTPAVYKKQVAKAKKIILQLPEGILDLILAGEWKQRAHAYSKSDWYIAEVSTDEVGVWRAAGHLPLKWTKGSLSETGGYVAKALKHGKKFLKGRSFLAIPGIIKTSLSLIQKEKYLLPIAFKGGTGTKGRRGLPKMKGDLDDGCMRSVALAVTGKKKIKVYFGVPKMTRR